MASQLVAILVLGSLSLVSIYFYVKLSRSVLGGTNSRVMVSSFGFPDVVFTGALSLLFVAIMVASYGHQATIDSAVIIQGSANYVALILCTIGFLVIRGLNPLTVFGLRGEGWPVNGMIAMGWLVAAYPLILLAQVISYQFLSASAAPQEIVNFLMDSANWEDRLLVVVLAVVVAPVAEEFIFRGYIYGVLKKYGGQILAIVFSSVLFAAIHMHLPSMAGLFVLAVVLALVYERTGSLWAPILMHSAFNGLSVFVALMWPEAVLP